MSIVPIEVEHYASAKGNTILELNTEVINSLVKNSIFEKKYPPSRVMDIVNRTIPGAELNGYKAGDENFIRRPPEGASLTAEISGEMKYFFEGKNIVYKNIQLPGRNYRDRFNEVVDNRFENVDWDKLNKTELLEAAAVFCISSVASHINLDGNLRTGVGLAKFLVDRCGFDFELSVEKLNERKVELKNLLDESIFWLLPEEYTPKGLIDIGLALMDLRSEIGIGDNTITKIVKRNSYFEELSENIDGFLQNYSWDEQDSFLIEKRDLLEWEEGMKIGNRNLQAVCERLAVFFGECLNKRKGQVQLFSYDLCLVWVCLGQSGV